MVPEMVRAVPELSLSDPRKRAHSVGVRTPSPADFTNRRLALHCGYRAGATLSGRPDAAGLAVRDSGLQCSTCKRPKKEQIETTATNEVHDCWWKAVAGL